MSTGSETKAANQSQGADGADTATGDTGTEGDGSAGEDGAEVRTSTQLSRSPTRCIRGVSSHLLSASPGVAMATGS